MWEITFSSVSRDEQRRNCFGFNFHYPLSVNKQHRYPPGSQGDRPDDPRQLQNGK
ncbi:toxin CbtA domain protein [Escherichia coli 3-373-03_S4_C3]|nr:toxin CbtA domain protein [Escherichia coli 3-373-03_S4_C3]